jgi:hypothetical protein
MLYSERQLSYFLLPQLLGFRYFTRKVQEGDFSNMSLLARLYIWHPWISLGTVSNGDKHMGKSSA